MGGRSGRRWWAAKSRLVDDWVVAVVLGWKHREEDSATAAMAAAVVVG